MKSASVDEGGKVRGQMSVCMCEGGRKRETVFVWVYETN